MPVLPRLELLEALGARARGERLERIRQSPHFQHGVFRNPVTTRKTLPGTLWRTLWHQLRGREERVPNAPLDVVSLTREDFEVPPASGLRATWLGHATVLLEIDGARVLVDPVWSERASPSPRIGPKRFHRPPLPLADLPPLDVVLISHDHYDHLDMATVRSLAAREPLRTRFVAPLGVGAHLERWGIAPTRLRELDWGESTDIGAITFSATPARHFSGRALRDGNRTLWASWVIAGPNHRVFHSGDTGFFEGFAGIGRKHGPFDLTLIKIGAYGPTWPDIHLTPEQALNAHALLRGQVLLPIHWGTFNLAFHDWFEPPERLMAAAHRAGARVVIPRPGEAVEPAFAPPPEPWWRTPSLQPLSP